MGGTMMLVLLRRFGRDGAGMNIEGEAVAKLVC
jgi:hypothetical protein